MPIGKKERKKKISDFLFYVQTFLTDAATWCIVVWVILPAI